MSNGLPLITHHSSLITVFNTLRPAGWARSRLRLPPRRRAPVAAHAALPGLDDEDAEAAQFNPLAAHQGLFHRVEEGFDGLLGLHLGHARAVGHAVHNVEFDHSSCASVSQNLLEIEVLTG